jgi:hypothetical protein
LREISDLDFGWTGGWWLPCPPQGRRRKFEVFKQIILEALAYIINSPLRAGPRMLGDS